MKYFHLIWAGLWRKRTRTIFTMLSIVVAFLLFGLLQGINQGFNTVLANLDVDRLYVSAKTNMTDGLPISYLRPHPRGARRARGFALDLFRRLLPERAQRRFRRSRPIPSRCSRSTRRSRSSPSTSRR